MFQKEPHRVGGTEAVMIYTCYPTVERTEGRAPRIEALGRGCSKLLVPPFPIPLPRSTVLCPCPLPLESPPFSQEKLFTSVVLFHTL